MKGWTVWSNATKLYRNRWSLLTKNVRELGQRFGELGKYVGEIAEGTARLLHIAEIRENRITRYRGRKRGVKFHDAAAAIR